MGDGPIAIARRSGLSVDSCPFRGIPSSLLKSDSACALMKPTRVSHATPGRLSVGVLIGLTIVALVFGLT
jgi:hypothetical protein